MGPVSDAARGDAARGGAARGDAAVTLQGVERWLRQFAVAVNDSRDELTRLDAAIGDADHGTNMDRGMQAVVEKLDPAPDDGIGALLKTVGMTLVSTVGGAAGPLYGTLFLKMGAAAGDAGDLPLAAWAQTLQAGVEGVQARGKARLGDKTMVDALVPASDALLAAAAAATPLRDALRDAAAAAEQGMKATIPMTARKGRASYLGERSTGHQDPGATSSWLLLKTAAECLADQRQP
jgi:dihydroxyacetone kinase-like protein